MSLAPSAGEDPEAKEPDTSLRPSQPAVGRAAAQGRRVHLQDRLAVRSLAWGDE